MSTSLGDYRSARPTSEKKKPSTLRNTLAALFALVGLAALAVSAFRGRQQYLREHPPPYQTVIAPIPPDMVEPLRKGMQIFARTVLMATPQQQEQLAEIWKLPPRSLDEVIKYQQATAKVLTPAQRAIYDPVRKKFQDRIVDKMLEPASHRMTGSDFEKMSVEVKARLERRIGP